MRERQKQRRDETRSGVQLDLNSDIPTIQRLQQARSSFPIFSLRYVGSGK